MRDDGDLDVCMTIHLANMDERETIPTGDQMLEWAEHLASELGCVVLEREDMPDTLAISLGND